MKLFLSLFLFATAVLAEDTEPRNLYEKNFGRDNSFCYIGGQRLEVSIRGVNRYTEVQEKTYGEFVLGKTEDNKYINFPINKEHVGLVKLLEGKNSSCSKGLGYKIGDKEFAILLAQDNRPYAPKLIVQLVDVKTLEPGKVYVGPYLVENVEPYPNGFKFQSSEEKFGLHMGSVVIKGEKYTWQDRGFTYWVSFTDKGFNVLPKDTFERSKYRTAFKDEKDFLAKMFWSEKDKRFDNPLVYIAVNYQIKKGCIFVTQSQIKPTGEEDWSCISF